MNKRSSLLIITCMGLIAYQASAWPDRHPPMNDEFQEAMKQCGEENNLQKPERGQRPSEEERAKMDACLKSKGIKLPHDDFHATMKQCAEENNIQRPQKDQKPSEEDRAKMNACLKSKGIERPTPAHQSHQDVE